MRSLGSVRGAVSTVLTTRARRPAVSFLQTALTHTLARTKLRPVFSGHALERPTLGERMRALLRMYGARVHTGGDDVDASGWLAAFVPGRNLTGTGVSNVYHGFNDVHLGLQKFNKLFKGMEPLR